MAQPIQRRCRHCRRRFLVKRNSHQHYCSEKPCQRVRKRRWQQQAYHNDPDYRTNQQSAQQRWQQAHSGYWRQYYQAHQQRASYDGASPNSLTSNLGEPMFFVKMDALALRKALSSKGCRLFLGERDPDLKMDVFNAKLVE